MLLAILGTLLACSGPGKSPVETKPVSSTLIEVKKEVVETPPPPSVPSEPFVLDPLSIAVNEARQGGSSMDVGTHNISVPSEDYEVLYAMAGGDWNVYPAGNAVILQGTVQGPIGDEEQLMVWLTGSIPDVNPEGTTVLEMAVVFMEQENDYMTVSVPSSRDSSGEPAILLGVESMAVRDTNGDGLTEVVAQATFRPCCDRTLPDYTETIVLTIRGREVTVSYPANETAVP